MAVTVAALVASSAVGLALVILMVCETPLMAMKKVKICGCEGVAGVASVGVEGGFAGVGVTGGMKGAVVWVCCGTPPPPPPPQPVSFKRSAKNGPISGIVSRRFRSLTLSQTKKSRASQNKT